MAACWPSRPSFFRFGDLSTGKCLNADYVGHDPYVADVLFLGQSDTVATLGPEEAVRLWDARTGRRKLLLGHEGLLMGLAVTPDGKLLASSSYTGESASVRVWDATTGKQLHELAGRTKTEAVLRLAFFADGKRLAGACENAKVRVWSVESGALLSENDLELPGYSPNSVQVARQTFNSYLRRAVFSPDARLLVANRGGPFRVFSVETGKELRRFPTDGPSAFDMAISADGKRLLSNYQADSYASNPDGTVKHLDPKTHELPVSGTSPMGKKSGGRTCLAAGPGRLPFRRMGS